MKVPLRPSEIAAFGPLSRASDAGPACHAFRVSEVQGKGIHSSIAQRTPIASQSASKANTCQRRYTAIRMDQTDCMGRIIRDEKATRAISRNARWRQKSRGRRGSCACQTVFIDRHKDPLRNGDSPHRRLPWESFGEAHPRLRLYFPQKCPSCG